jgi:hypothetical protein
MEIEQERTETMSNPQYIEWVRSLGISSMWVNREGILRANDMMGSYDFRKKFTENLVDSKNSRIFTK